MSVAGGVAVDDVGIVGLKEEVGAEAVVERQVIVGLERAPGACVAVAVPPAVELEPAGQGHAQRGIPAVGAMGRCGVGGHAAVRGHVFAAHGPPPLVGQGGPPAHAPHAPQLRRAVGVALVDVAPVPPEGAEGEPFHGREPQGADEVFVAVFVGVVDALPVEQAHLVAQPRVAVAGRGEQVALQLHAQVAARAFVLAVAVGYGGELHRGLGIRAQPHVERAVGVFEPEGALELPQLDAQERELLPLHIGVHHAWPLVGAGGAVDLQLQAVGKIGEAPPAHAEAHKAQVEASVRALAALRRKRIFPDDVSAETEGGRRLFKQPGAAVGGCVGRSAGADGTHGKGGCGTCGEEQGGYALTSLFHKICLWYDVSS